MLVVAICEQVKYFREIDSMGRKENSKPWDKDLLFFMQNRFSFCFLG